MAPYSEKTYYSQLEVQIELNKEQLHELRSLLSVERLKIWTCLIFMGVMISVAIAVGFAVARGGIDYRFDHYAALVNIGAVFILFGLFEILALLTESLTLSARLRRLITRQLNALHDAAEDLVDFRGY